MASDSAIQVDANELSVIDLSGFRAGDGSRRKVAEAIGRACQETGFFYLVGHGVPRGLRAAAWRQAQAFFDLPEKEKRALAVTRDCYRGYIPMAAFSANAGGKRPDLYEGYKLHLDLPPDDPLIRAGVPLYGANRWPTRPAGFRPAFEAYWTALTDLAEDLLAAFALALGQDETCFLEAFDKPLSNISLLHYPPQSPATAPDQMGIHPHRDTDAFTILLPDRVGGLEVQHRDGRWIAAPAIDDAFIVNIGNMIECWTGGRFVSTPHRVVNRSGRERYSIAYFAIPHYQTVIRPLDGCDEEIAVGPFMEQLYASNWD